ncbi:MAG: uracil-DNA glycosylase [Gammaproteobacteria bacterium]
MGLTVWARRRERPAPAGVATDPFCDTAQPPCSDDPGPYPESAAPVCEEHTPAFAGWTELEAAVAGCTRCALAKGRKHTVFGVGARDARWLLVGEAPGAEEDKRGEPFVGRAGKLLDAMLAALGLAREEVFITNIVKCRPPGNRNPEPEEAAACSGYLAKQIEWIAPELILAMGGVAAQNLLGVETPVGRMRGRVHEGPNGVPVVVTYHPAYLLRRPIEKRKVWQDLKFALATAAPRTS